MNLTLYKLKYIGILALPITVAIGIWFQGIWSYLTLFVFFGLIPLIELVSKPDNRNLSEQERIKLEQDPYFDLLLYSMIPIQIGIFIWWLFTIVQVEDKFTSIGMCTSMIAMCGVIGINVGHELGHRTKRWEQLLGEILLSTSLENHFLPYHNRGHHAQVATPEDPATARKNEPLYLFWIRSHFGSYFQAWGIEINRMKIIHSPILSFNNRMVVYTLVNLAICTSVYVWLGGLGLYYFLIAAIGGILLLETVNYIEHYGLLRQKRENGQYERVRRAHSWNSNHVFGRAILFELSRHSDHHYKPDKPYQLLETHDESPQMPTGYPGMMLLSLLPFLFFRVVNPLIPKNANHLGTEN